MPIKNNLLIAFMFWVLFGYSNAIAQSHKHHEHRHYQAAIVSPFDSKQEVMPLHCFLKGHADRLVCPHSKIEGDQTPSIAKECDGKRSGSTTKNKYFGSEFAEANIIVQTDYSLRSKLFQTALPSFNRVIDCLDPPPIIVIL